MGTNTLTPRLDKSLDINEMGTVELTTLHTQVHTVWEGLMQGRYYEDWTFEECSRIHADILTRMSQENIPHIILNSTLDTGMSEVQSKISDMLKKQSIDKNERKDLIETINKQQKQIDTMLNSKTNLDEEMGRIKGLLNHDKKINSNEKNNLLEVIAKQQKKIEETITNGSDIKASMEKIQGLLKEGKQLNQEEKIDLKDALTKQSQKFADASLSMIDEFKKLHESEAESKKDIINNILKKQSESEENTNKNLQAFIEFQKEQDKKYEERMSDITKKSNERKKEVEEKEKILKEEADNRLSLADLRQGFSDASEVLPSHIGVLGFNEKGYTTDKEIGIFIEQSNKSPDIEEAVLQNLNSIRDRIKFYYLGSEGLEKFKDYTPLFSLSLDKVKATSVKIIKESLAGEVPDTEEKKDIAKLPKEIKSNIKDLLKFAKEQGCPNCGSKQIRLVGFMESGERAKFGCVDCQLLWVVGKKEEGESYAVYKYEKSDNEQLSKKVWDKVYPNLIKSEKRFNDLIAGEFKAIETKYLKAYDSGKKKFADEIIGEDSLHLALKAEMEEIAYDGEITVAKDLKRAVPKALNPNAVKWIDAYSIKLAGEVAADVRENIRLQIAEGIKEGAGVREIRKRINSVFSEGMRVNVPAKMENGKIVKKAYTRLVSAETRARAIAQTETMRAFNRGRYESMKAIDGITGWRYEASADERTCAQCMSLDGQEFKKIDDSQIPPIHVSCRCTFSYLFGKKKQEEPKLKKNIKPKFKLQRNSKTEKYRVEIPNLAGDDSQILELETSEKDIERDIGWIEHGAQLKNLKEYFLHGKKIKGRWLSDNKILKKASDEIPYVLSGMKHIPLKGFSALPKGLMARIPRNLRWYELNLQGVKAYEMIAKIRSLLFQKKEPTVKVRDMTTEEEIKMMLKNIEPMKIENQINIFLEKHNYKVHKHSCSIDTIKLEKLGGWPQKKIPFKLPLPVEGIALTSGAFRGMSGEWIYYPEEVIKKSAPLLTGCQIRLDHSEDGSPLSTVVGWVTKSWKAKDKRDKSIIKYKGLIFDHDRAKDIYNKKIRKTSVSPYVKEKIDEEKGLIAEDIAKFEEISILSGNNPACPKATVVAS